MEDLNIRVFILKMDQNRYSLFEETVNEEYRFSEPVDDFELSRSLPLLCFIFDDQDRIAYIAFAKKGMRAGTNPRRLNIIDPIKLKNPIPSDPILEEVSGKVRNTVNEKLSYGGLLPPRSSEYFIDTVIDLFPNTEDILSQFSRRSRERFKRLSTNTKKLLGQQKDAVATAMTIAGIDRGRLRSWSLKSDSAPESFLDGLQDVYLLEDQVIANDLKSFPGYDFLKSQSHGSTVFRDDRVNKLTVVLANRLPLEKQTGTDLIYFNETFGSFVMVQYKMMDSDDGKAIFRRTQEDG
ncbi:hypothetical protein [Algoriphagus sp. PAP.12]|uniref:hypothetical protein n=1 Tax=Algoriphagus sp. PAP.12 TaxID=2996678 RepID=UPI00227BE828|nr:hypothetical protein [Algoriphagus sp. PAP.12]